MNDYQKQFLKQLKVLEKRPTEPPDTGQLFSHDISPSGHKSFLVTTYQKIYSYLNQTNLWYEDHTFNNNIKLHIDIDYNRKYNTELERDEEADVIIGEVVDIVNTKLNDELEIVNSPIIVMMSDTLKKLSLHIIYPEVIFTSMLEMKLFMQNVSSYADMRVYSARRPFRMPLNSKYGKYNPLHFYTSFNYVKPSDNFKLFYDSCICSDGEGYIIDYSHMITEVVPSNELVIGSKPLLNYRPHNDAPRLYHYVNYNLTMVKKALESLDESVLYDYNSWLIIMTSIKDLWLGIKNESHRIELYNIFDTICSSASLKYIQKHPNKKINYDRDGNYRAFHSLKHHIIDINYLFNKAEMKYFIHPFYDYRKIIFNIDNHTNKILANETYINDNIVPKLLKFKNIFIKSPTGTGKTTLLKKMLTHLNNENIISIISRVNLGGEHLKLTKLNKDHLEVNVGLSFYKGMTPQEYKTCNKLVVQLESIIKCNYKLFKDATVILDETNSLLSHLRSPTFKDRRASCYKYLIKIIKDADTIICLDADLSDDNIEFIKQIRNTDYIVYQNVCKNKSNVEAIFYDSSLKTIKIMAERIRNKQYFVACFDSLTMMETVLEYLSKFGDRSEWLVYSSDETKKNPERFIIDTLTWLKRFVFYTPSIIYGLDFNYKDYIVDVFCIITKFHLNSMQVYQMMTRVRHMNKVHVFCHERLYYLKYKSKQDVIDEFHAYERVIGSLISGKQKQDDLDETPYQTMYFAHTYMDSLLKTNMKGYLMDMMVLNGFNLIHDNEIINDDFLNPKQSIKQNIDSFLTVDNDGRNAFEKELLADPKKLDKHYNLMMFIDDKYNKNIIDLIAVNLLTESVKSKATKIKLVSDFMKDLKMETLDKFNIDVISRFTEPFVISPWLNANLNTIKSMFDIRGKKYDTITFYTMYQLLNTLLDNMFGSELFETRRKKVSKVDYFWYQFNKESYLMHITAQETLDILHIDE